MTTTALIFYPQPYVGFNKTQLLKRQLTAAGIIGSKFKSTFAFSIGSNFRQFVPKVDSIRKFQYGMIRIQILAVGVWATTVDNPKINEYSNVVLIEGDTIGYPLERYRPLCEMLSRITGDTYEVSIAHEPLRAGISEPRKTYRADFRPAGRRLCEIFRLQRFYPY
jgi:hypothetical protein